MQPRWFFGIVLFGCLLFVLHSRAIPQISSTVLLQEDLGSSRTPAHIECMIVEEDGEPAALHRGARGKLRYTLFLNGNPVPGHDGVAVNGSSGGLNRWRNLKAGIYEIVVEGTDSSVPLRPLRVEGVLVRPGVTTRLELVLHEGRTLETVNNAIPVLAAQVTGTDEFQRMRRKLRQLEEQVEDLKQSHYLLREEYDELHEELRNIRNTRQ